MSDTQIFFPEGKKINIAGQEFTIKPFVLKNRRKVINIITEVLMDVAKHGTTLQEVKNDNVAAIKIMVDAAGDRIIDLYEVALGAPREWLEDNVTIADEIVIIQAIMETNNLPFLVARAKEMIAKIKQK